MEVGIRERQQRLGQRLFWNEMERLLGLRGLLSRFRVCEIYKIETKFTTRVIARQPLARGYMSRTSEKLEKQLKSADMISEDFTIVYRGGMDNYIHLAYTSSTVLLFIGVLSIWYAIDSDEPQTFPMDTRIQKLIGPENYTQLGIMYAAYFAMAYSMRHVSVGYVLRMYYNAKTQTYRAVRVGILPTATRTHDFQARTLTRVQKKSFVPWWNMQYKCNGVKLLLLENSFRTSADYDRLFLD